jgi:hypothetical protein
MVRKKKPLPRIGVWELVLTRLREFRKTHGHCNVPRNYPPDRSLGIWVQNQRRFWRTRVLQPDRIDRLNALGFEWNVKDANWERMFSALEEFKQAQTGPGWPKGWGGNRDLERWVDEQRQLHRTGQLRPERLARLKRIGFAWDAQESKWELMFSALLDFKRSHGNCDVPRRWSENPALGVWVALHRSLGRKGKLPNERVTRLNEIGFRW